MSEHRTHDAAATEAYGESLAHQLEPGDVVLLEGALAAGKTTLVRGLVKGLGGDPAATSSPTFVILQSYSCDDRGIGEVHHLDLYRLDDTPAVLREIGVEEILAAPASVTVVEWPRSVLEAWLSSGTVVWRVHITVVEDDTRSISVSRDVIA